MPPVPPVPPVTPVAPAPPAAASGLLLPDAAATQALGAALGRRLQAGDLLGLDGPLGAGKTCLVQGLARGLGVAAEEPIGSPTFTLINEHHGRLPLYHVDLYRLTQPEELLELGLWELAGSGGVLAVEWLSRFPQALPQDRLELTLHPTPEGARVAVLRATGPQSAARLRDWAATPGPATEPGGTSIGASPPDGDAGLATLVTAAGAADLLGSRR